MKPLIGVFARALCLVGAVGLTSLIVAVHAADSATLGARAVIVGPATSVAVAHTRASVAAAAVARRTAV